MKKDTKQIEEIIARLKDLRKLVRAESLAGSNVEQIRHELEKHEIAFTQRLLELKEHNARVEQQTKAEAAAPGE